MTVNVICKYCKKQFKIYSSRIKIGCGKYCSKKCYTLSQIKKINKICQYCGKSFKVNPYRIKIGGGKYCSKQCADRRNISEKTKRKIGKANWKGGKLAFKKRQRNNLRYRLNHRISNGMLSCLKRGSKNGRSWKNLVGYNIEQLQKHLKKTMPEDYIWQDFLNGDLQIDHIIPVKAFDFDKPEDLGFKYCWNLNNLRLIKKEENNKKRAKIIKPYQTNLNITVLRETIFKKEKR